jgi:hypothetical protein|eukprot:1236853-Prymnesium_polylepis.1
MERVAPWRVCRARATWPDGTDQRERDKWWGARRLDAPSQAAAPLGNTPPARRTTEYTADRSGCRVRPQGLEKERPGKKFARQSSPLVRVTCREFELRLYLQRALGEAAKGLNDFFKLPW